MPENKMIIFVWWRRREWQCRCYKILFVEWSTVCIIFVSNIPVWKHRYSLLNVHVKWLIYHIYIVLRDGKDSEERHFISEKKFIVEYIYYCGIIVIVEIILFLTYLIIWYFDYLSILKQTIQIPCYARFLYHLYIGASWEKSALGARFINLTVDTARHFYMMKLHYRASYLHNMSMIILNEPACNFMVMIHV